MHIGLIGPCSSALLADLLYQPSKTEVGYGGYFVATLARALIERGHCLSIVTLSPAVTEPTVLKGARLTYYVGLLRSRGAIRDLYTAERKSLREAILLAQPDLLHAHWTYEYALACLETDLPTLITSHDNAFKILRYSPDLYRLGRLFIQLHILRKARFLTAVSPYLANSLRLLAKARFEVVPNPIVVPQKTQMCNRTSGTVKIATILNGWGTRKNPEIALKAFNLLQRSLPEAELYMYGYDFEEGGPASQWASRHGINHNVQFCGVIPYPQLQNKLKEMSVLLHPAQEESFGMTILEAMALGVPVVGGMKSGAVPWLLDEGRAGFLTDVKNPHKIAQALLTCLEHPAECEQKQEHAYNRVVRLFSPRVVAEQYEQIYERVMTSC